MRSISSVCVRPGGTSRRGLRQVAAVVTVAALLGPRPVAAQTSTPGAPVQVKTAPRLTPVGTPVTISGLTYVDGKHLQVRITVQPPSPAAPMTLTAAAHAKNGTFSTQFQETKTPGEYRVTATSPDGQGRGETAFTVATPGGVAEHVTEVANDVIAVSEEALGQTFKNVQSMPPSSVAQELNEKLTATAEKIDALKKRQADIDKALEALSEAAAADAEIQEVVDKDMREVIDWAEEADDEVDRMRARLEDHPTDVSLCDRLELANEGLVTMSNALVLCARGGALAFKLFMNNGLPAVVNLAPKLDSTQKSIVTEAIRVAVGAAKSFEELVNAGGDLLNNATQILLKEVFPTYCTRFEGPMTASFQATFSHKGRPWWTYGVQLAGRLVLRHVNDAEVGKPVRVTGELEGNATRFDFTENVGLLDPPRRMGPALILRHRIIPIGFVDTTKDPFGAGLFIRMATPGYFYVPVEGELVKDRVVLKVLEARVDFFEEVKNRLVLIYFSLGMPILPKVETFEFPIQKAQFILSRGMGRKGAPAAFTITQEDDKQIIASTFERAERPGEAEVAFVVNVKACAPHCE